MVQKTSLSSDDLILPVFVIEGEGEPEAIESMPEGMKKVFLLFSNCHHGQAAQNGLQMKILFGEKAQ